MAMMIVATKSSSLKHPDPYNIALDVSQRINEPVAKQIDDCECVSLAKSCANCAFNLCHVT